MQITNRSTPLRRLRTLVLALVAAMSLAACGDADEDSNSGDNREANPSPSRTPTETSGGREAGTAGGTPIRISFGGAVLTGHLGDTATARDLTAQLPLALTFSDHNDAEKTAPLARELSLDGTPEGHDPAAGEIGYFAPGGDLVLYYDDDAPFFNGIVPIGRFDDPDGALRRQAGSLRIIVGRAG